MNIRYNIAIGRSGAWSPHYFFSDGTLYMITMDAGMDAFADVMSGLEAKWGPPRSRASDMVQNGFGAKFPHVKTVWSNQLALITVDAPHETADELNVVYALTAAVQKLQGPFVPDKDKM